MFFLERYMKKLKGFVQKRENLEGYMEEGFIVYELLYYSSEYTKQLEHTPDAVICFD